MDSHNSNNNNNLKYITTNLEEFPINMEPLIRQTPLDILSNRWGKLILMEILNFPILEFLKMDLTSMEIPHIRRLLLWASITRNNHSRILSAISLLAQTLSSRIREDWPLLISEQLKTYDNIEYR
jgi:hypothetical protein